MDKYGQTFNKNMPHSEHKKPTELQEINQTAFSDFIGPRTTFREARFSLSNKTSIVRKEFLAVSFITKFVIDDISTVETIVSTGYIMKNLTFLHA